MLPTSTALDYISEPTDVCKNSGRDVPRFDSTCIKSEQSELETGSITDDCKIYLMFCSIFHCLSYLVKRVQTKSSITRLESIELLDTIATGSTNETSSTDTMSLPINSLAINDKQPKVSVQVADNSNVGEEIEPCTESDRSNVFLSEAVC